MLVFDLENLFDLVLMDDFGLGFRFFGISP